MTWPLIFNVGVALSGPPPTGLRLSRKCMMVVCGCGCEWLCFICNLKFSSLFPKKYFSNCWKLSSVWKLFTLSYQPVESRACWSRTLFKKLGEKIVIFGLRFVWNVRERFSPTDQNQRGVFAAEQIAIACYLSLTCSSGIVVFHTRIKFFKRHTIWCKGHMEPCSVELQQNGQIWNLVELLHWKTPCEKWSQRAKNSCCAS